MMDTAELNGVLLRILHKIYENFDLNRHNAMAFGKIHLEER